MTLLTAHKILIGSAVALFAFYALWELRAFTAGAGNAAALRALLAAAASVSFAVYLRSVWKRPPYSRKNPTRRE